MVIDGQDVGAMNQRQLTKLRRTRLGFIFQAFNLVPTLTAAENITLPLDIARRRVDRTHFEAIVTAVGLKTRLHHPPASCPAVSSSASRAPARWSPNPP